MLLRNPYYITTKLAKLFHNLTVAGKNWNLWMSILENGVLHLLAVVSSSNSVNEGYLTW